MKALIIAKDLKENKTGRYLKRFDGLDWYYCISEQSLNLENWPNNIITYKTREQGANIAHRNALDFGEVIVFDDDYGSIVAGGKSVRPETHPDFIYKLYTALKMAEEVGFVVGGYSGGAMNDTWIKKNIMQIFVSGRINKYFRKDSNLYRYNDDVNACIMAYMRGEIPIGLYAFRSGSQTGELIDNTNQYNDYSWGKSFMSVLYSPMYCKIVPWDLKRRPRWHHRVQWNKISPKIILE